MQHDESVLPKMLERIKSNTWRLWLRAARLRRSTGRVLGLPCLAECLGSANELLGVPL